MARPSFVGRIFKGAGQMGVRSSQPSGPTNGRWAKNGLPKMLVCLVSTLLAAGAALGETPTIDQIRARFAQTSCVLPETGFLVLKGITNRRAVWQTFEMVVDHSFRYRTDIKGPLRESEGYDRAHSWKLGVSGVPHETILTDREIPRIVTSVISGFWACPTAPFTFKVEDSSSGALNLQMQCRDGRIPVILSLNPKTYFVERLSYWGADGDEVWSFREFKKIAGTTVPTRISHQAGGSTDTIVVQAGQIDRNQPVSFSIPRVESNGFRFDPLAGSQVKLLYQHGHLFVRAVLDGVEEGWFVFDTGAGVMVIDSKIASKHDSPTIGSEVTVGVTSSSDLKVCQGISFQLGPLSLENPTYMLGDMTSLSKGFGMPIAGICGYDLISRASFEIDVRAGTMGIYPPGRAPLPKGAKWIPLGFDEDTPSILCRFEGDRVGTFSVDTGSNSTVDFLAPATETLGLTKGRALTSTSGGSGGSPAVAYEMGPVAYFDFAGVRYKELSVGFQHTNHGTFACPFFEGFIGMKLMARSRLLLDYQKQRMAAIPY